MANLDVSRQFGRGFVGDTMRRGSYTGGGTIARNGQLPPETQVVVVRKPRRSFSNDRKVAEPNSKPPAQPPVRKTPEQIEAEMRTARSRRQNKEERRGRISREATELRVVLINAIKPLLYLLDSEIISLDRMDLVLEAYLDTPEADQTFISTNLAGILKIHLKQRAHDPGCEPHVLLAPLLKSFFIAKRMDEVAIAIREGRPFKASKATRLEVSDDEVLRGIVLKLLSRATGFPESNLRNLEVTDACFRRARILPSSSKAWVVGAGLVALERAIAEAIEAPDLDDPDAVRLPPPLDFLMARPLPMQQLRKQVREVRLVRQTGRAELADIPDVPKAPSLGRHARLAELTKELADLELRKAKLTSEDSYAERESLESSIQIVRYSLRSLGGAGVRAQSPRPWLEAGSKDAKT